MEREVDRMRAKILQAITSGLNEGSDLTRTKVRRAMREQTGLIKLASVTKRQRTMRAYAVGREALSSVGPARPASLSYAIVFSGRPATKAEEFRTVVTRGVTGASHLDAGDGASVQALVPVAVHRQGRIEGAARIGAASTG
ncbi:MAG TPA: hypothetical protein VGG79_13540 [Roseiarcus sp.]